MPKAVVRRAGNLLIVETEYGQRAVVPADSLCDLVINFNLTITNLDVECEKVGKRGKR